jgi:hypothetical protein
MSSYQGSTSFVATGYTLVFSGWARDPQSGVRFEQRYEGTETGISTLALVLVSQGAAVRYDATTAGGKRTLQASWGRDPNEPESSEVPTDRWELELAPYQIAIWRHPDVMREAETYGTSAYRKLLLDAVSTGVPFPESEDIYPVAKQVFDLLTQGTEYWETQRPIIRKQRTYSPTYTTRTVLSPTNKVYSRASLISTFSPPTDFQDQMPTDPTDAAPSGKSWGWMLRQQSFGYQVSSRKFEESVVFEGAYWETRLYTFL